MNVMFSEDAWEEFCAIKANTPLAKAIRDTIKDIQRGNKLGKEEHLKYDMSGLLSRRLDKKRIALFTEL